MPSVIFNKTGGHAPPPETSPGDGFDFQKYRVFFKNHDAPFEPAPVTR